jgi:hypothetical protein
MSNDELQAGTQFRAEHLVFVLPYRQQKFPAGAASAVHKLGYTMPAKTSCRLSAAAGTPQQAVAAAAMQYTSA